MIFQLDIQRIIADATSTFKRFPLVMISAVLATVFSILLIDMTSSEANHVAMLNISKWIATFYLGLALLLAFGLFCEKNKLSALQSALMQGGAVVILLGARFLILDNPNYATSVPQFALLSIFAHLAVAFSPYMTEGEENGFWYYNQYLFFRFCLSVVYSVVLYVGIAGAIGAVQFLFGVNIDYRLYFKIWVIIVTFFNTWFFLAGVPSDFKALDEERDYPHQLKVFTQFVLIPLISLYLAILYLYEIKLIFDWHLPKGLVSWLVLVFSIGGIFSLLLIHPIREKSGNQWIKIYAKTFYLAILPLIALLFISIGLRVVQYGITENRYMVLVLAGWLLGMSAYNLINKNTSIKIIPISLAGVALFVGFVPFVNAFDVARFEQNRILYQLLVKNNIWKNNTLTPQKTKDYTQIASVLEYLNERGKIRDIESYLGNKKNTLLVFEKEENKKSKKNQLKNGLEALSYEKLQILQDAFAINDGSNKNNRAISNDNYAKYFSSQANENVTQVEGFKTLYVGTLYSHIQYDEDSKSKSSEDAKQTITHEAGEFFIKIHPLTYETRITTTHRDKEGNNHRITADFNLMKLINSIYEKYNTNEKRDKVAQKDAFYDFENADKSMKGRIIIKRIALLQLEKSENIRMENMNFEVLIK